MYNKDLRDRAKELVSKDFGSLKHFHGLLELAKEIAFQEEKPQSVNKQEVQIQEEWPKKGDRIFYIDVYGNNYGYTWDVFIEPELIHVKHFTGIFHSYEEADLEKLRREAIHATPKWLPEDNELFWNWNETGAEELYWSVAYMEAYWIGNVHKTHNDSEAWGKKYGEAFAIPEVCRVKSKACSTKEK